MDKKSAAIQVKPGAPSKQNLLEQNQKAHRVVGNEKFKIDSSDFPSLQDISVNAKNQSKRSLEQSKASITYSDKLKAPPQERSSNFFKFGSYSKKGNEPACISAKSQSAHFTKQTSQTNHKLQGGSDVKVWHVPGSIQTSDSNPLNDLVTGKIEVSNNSSQCENQESSSRISDSSQDASDGWTVCQKHSSTKKHRMHANDRNRGFRTDGICDEEASSTHTGKFNNSNRNQYSNKSNEHLASLTSNVRHRSSVGYERFKRDVPCGDSNSKFRENSKYRKPYPASTRVNGQTNEEQCSNNRNRTRAYNENFSRNTWHGEPSNRMNPGIDRYKDPKAGQRQNILNAEDSGASHNPMLGTSQQFRNSGVRSSNTSGVPSQQNSGQRLGQTNADTGATKSRKKRKSKVKRQAAFQPGKIGILTPETHSKILNQNNSAGTKMQSNAVTNIKDDGEYPELGIGVVPKTNKEIPVKIVNLSAQQIDNCDASTSQTAEINIEGTNDKVVESVSTQEEIKAVPIHTNDLMRVSIFDMLMAKKHKKKEVEEKVEEEVPIEKSPVKVKTKKVITQSVNPLASSKLTMKRGKEREQPKAKKPSKMRKLILMGRKLKKENIELKDNDVQNNEQSDIDNDILSDGSSLSPIKSPINEDSEWDDFLKDNTIQNYCNVMPNELSVLVDSCKKVLFQNQENEEHIDQPKLNVSPIESYLPVVIDPKNIELDKDNVNACKMSVDDIENKSCLTVSNTLLDQKIRLEEKFSNLNIKDSKQCLENDAVKESHLLVNRTIPQNLNEEDFTSSRNSTIGFCSDLEQSNFGSVVEPGKDSSKNNKNNRLEDVTEVSNSFKKEIKIDLRHKIDLYANHLAQAVLKDCLSVEEVFKTKKSSELELTKELKKCLESQNETVANDSNALDFNKKKEDTNDVPAFSLKYNSTIDKHRNYEVECAFESMSDASILNFENTTQTEAKLSETNYSEKEKLEAAKILLHTRRFRDYCTHFVTKELDQTVFLLIDDLARFQDRMHQKDPVKARVKRRLMYGIKEIKKHLTLKKLKGIIIATDIEDNKTEGGLNDLLKEVITVSEAYHIPYIFSHRRFNLGKVCRKPAPVSCVGILNYDGSEKNFKKMLELQEESKSDYTVITNKIIQLLRDSHIKCLFETIAQSIAPYEISKIILRDIFSTDILGDISNTSESIIKPVISSRNLEPKTIESNAEHFSVLNKNNAITKEKENSDVTEKIINNMHFNIENVTTYESALDDSEKTQIYTLLKKYSIIKT